jgi:methionyl-tRNA formyltransferase
MNLISLFANGKLGIDLIEAIENNAIPSEINLIVINGENKYSQSYHKSILNHPVVIKRNIPVIVYTNQLFENILVRESLSNSKLVVSALFGHVFPKSFIDDSSSKIINLHPSYLPVGRGADPVAWGIIENRQQGATIHEIDEKLDNGRIISQEKIDSDLAQNSGKIYQLIMESLKRQFIALLNSDNLGESGIEQEGEATYHNTRELEELKKKLLNDIGEVEKTLRIIQSLTFNDGRSATIKASDGNLWEVNVAIKRIKSTE